MLDPAELVHLITWYASKRQERLTPIRLVKFLYLADLYYARRNSGQSLTGWPWAFVHYGPFCGMSLDAINRAAERQLIEVSLYESRYDGEEHKLYHCSTDEEPSLHERLPVYLTSPLQKAVRQWGDDTAGLLHHVYFETEPMIPAMPRDILDFSLAREEIKEKAVEMRPLSKKQIQRAREAIAKLRTARSVQAFDTISSPSIYDDAYFEGVRILDGEGLSEGVSGTAAISPEEDA